MNDTPIKEDQPKPAFTLVDLSNWLNGLDDAIAKFLENKSESNLQPIALTRHNLRKLMTIVQTKMDNKESIDPVLDPTKEQETIARVFQQERPMFHVSGLQLIEYGRIQGTSLYSTMPKAKHIRDILNRKFAELKVDHEAKIVQYPVF